MTPSISILILTHNATYYVFKTLYTLRKTAGVDYEVVVVDNDSWLGLKLLLPILLRKKWINQLFLLNRNAYFAEGNNIASRLARPNSTHFLLLNSDVEIRRPDWLAVLLANHEYGITSYGVSAKDNTPRVDGYCFLIDKSLYLKYQLDESFPWGGSISKLQAQVLDEGHTVKGYANHNLFLYHYGRKSGKAYKLESWHAKSKTNPGNLMEAAKGKTPIILDTPPRIV